MGGKLLYWPSWLSLVDSLEKLAYSSFWRLELYNSTDKWFCNPEGIPGLSWIISACYSSYPFRYTSQIHCKLLHFAIRQASQWLPGWVSVKTYKNDPTATFAAWAVLLSVRIELTLADSVVAGHVAENAKVHRDCTAFMSAAGFLSQCDRWKVVPFTASPLKELSWIYSGLFIYF